MTHSRGFSVLPENLGPRLMGLISEGTCDDDDNDNDDSLTYVSPSLKISDDPTLVAHGRGLVTTTPIQAGELLFVHPPTIKAELSQVLRIYKNKAGSRNGSDIATGGTSSLLESIAETVLLKEMKRAVRGRRKESSARTAASFLALNSDHSTKHEGDTTAEANSWNNDQKEEEQHQQQRCLLRVLLGKGESEETEKILEECGTSIDDNDYLLGIIRHNAFGPDFHHYHRMENELWQSNTNIDSSAGSAGYSRILGHYPLAAMINHSCGPTNATRVFYKEIMVATATQIIPAGTEILWPYCPPISPFPMRSQQLKHCYGFSCLSNRSVLEERAYSIGIPPPEIPMGLNTSSGGGSNSSNRNHNDDTIDAQFDLKRWETILESLEVWYEVVAAKIDPLTMSSDGERRDTEDPNQQPLLLQHGLRLGHTYLYIRYFNEALNQQNSQLEASVRDGIVREAEKLHSAFLAIHNACTEHLSLLHLCYELSATTTTTATTTTSSSKDKNRIENNKRETIRFWTERLKEAHLCRYSNQIVGMDLATLRTVLKHTRTVLRTQDGWKNSGVQNGINSFI